jgi:hypothetical protein
MAAAAAFAASPQGRRLLQQAKEYANRPETKQKARQFVEQVQAKRKARGVGGTGPTAATGNGAADDRWPRRDAPPYGTPPKA